MQGVVRVRIRGIYATALTKLLLDKGFQIVQASNLIAARFGIPQVPAAADVTVKSIEDEPSRLLVIGYPDAVDAVVAALRSMLRYTPVWCSPVGLYATVVARIEGVKDGECVARINEVELVVQDVGECREGEYVTLYVVKAPVYPGERGRATPGVRVVGDYAMLYKGGQPRVTISEHISKPERRALLSSIAYEYREKGYGVHWRSSARDAEEQVLKEELARLEEMLKRVEENAVKLASEGTVGVVAPGEKICIAEVSAPDKAILDDIRDEVLPTAKLHHSIKSIGDETLQAIIDYEEEVLGIDRGLRDRLAAGLLRYIASRLEGRRVRIEHVKLDGKVVELGPAYVKEVRVEEGGLRLRLERRVRSPGVYDGLGVEKEPGDIIETIIDTREWIVTHHYYSQSGGHKGTYININTPPEVSLDRIRYIDLTIDIVKKPDGTVQVIDVEELKRQVEAGIVGEKLLERIKEVVRRVANTELQI